MIGDGWDGDPAARPDTSGESAGSGPTRRRVAVVTGTRAEFGLLRPVMAAVRDHPDLELMVIAAGAHLIPPAETFREVKQEFAVTDSVPMQRPGPATRTDDAESAGRGVARFARSFAALRPDWVVVLGDRIEAFAAAAAASIGGFALAHIHGGDRAEGIADEAMRHAITKLAHLHLAASLQSAERIRRMGEPAEAVHVVGSPAIDDLPRFEPLGDAAWSSLGAPAVALLLHPLGRHAEEEEAAATAVIEGVTGVLGPGAAVLALAPNGDPGRGGITRAIDAASEQGVVRVAGHLPRPRFVGLLRRLAGSGGVLVGNSSAGLIEAAALRLPAVNVGARQAGRERPMNVVDSERESPDAVAAALRRALEMDRASITHPYGDGHTGERIAGLLARVDPHSSGLLRKRCAF